MKKRAWRWIALLIGAPAVAIAALAAYAWLSSAAAFARHEKDVTLAIEELRREDRRQPLLFGEGVEGNGWESFSLGMAGLAKAPYFDEEGRITGDCEVDKAELRLTSSSELDKIFERHVADVDKLRAAFTRKEFDSHPKYDGLQIPPDGVSQCSHASRYLAAWSRRLHDQGRDREALETLTLALAVVQGLARQESLFCHRGMGFGEGLALESLRRLLEGYALRASELRGAGQRFDQLLRERPSITHALRVERVLTCRTLLELRAGPIAELPMVDVRDEELLLGWRYLCSRRMMIASALDLWTSFACRYLELEPLPIPQRVARAQAIASEVVVLRNPMLWKVNPVLHELYFEDGRSLSHLTLARAALALAEYEVVNGHAAARLEDLVPGQLKAVPVDPLTGTAFTYGDGKIGPPNGGSSSVDRRGEPLLSWTVRKKQ